MKLTYDFDEDFFRLMVSEEFEKADARVDEIEDEIDGFLSGAKTLYLGNGANIHLSRERFEVSLDTENAAEGYAILIVNDASGAAGTHEAVRIVISAGERLKLKKGEDGRIVAIKLKGKRA